MMQFPFTFSLNIPGLHNPFLASPGPVLAQSRIQGGTTSREIALPRIPLPNSLSPPAPLARKRGWVPSVPEPSHAATFAASTTGYLDTPAKYRDMPLRDPAQEVEEMIAAGRHHFSMENEPSRLHSTHSRSFMLFTCNLLIIVHVELPPAKRRRTLAGSIVSTALSAALIGTAVGLTVYRLWRDRGKLPDQLPPPPPYQRGDWAPEPPKQIEPTSSLKTRKSRTTPSSVRRTVGRHHRKPRAKLQTVTPPRSVSPAYTSPQSELDYVHVHQHADVEPDLGPESDEMDWIGDRLTRLIQEGRRALGREIVVMSDAKEDEVDDGSNDWEEEQDNKPIPSIAAPSISRRGSVRSLRRTHKPRDIPLPPSYSPYPMSPPNSASPRKRHFEPVSVHRSPGRSTHEGYIAPSTPCHTSCGTSAELDALAHIVSSSKEDESAWQSPELRESMERARARYLQRRVQ
ncbi:hypothetical protein HD554DRAFT_564060 [Boletus coccyginus]|nr:hypothetical protein HD554DRAFT_564060 [Boletus coccyginus]